jgi:hypothetical protein
VRTPESCADSLSQLVGTEQTVGPYHLALAMNLFGLYRTLSHGLFLGNSQVTILIAASLPLFLTSRL